MAIRILNEGIDLTKDDYEELEDQGIERDWINSAYKEAHRILDKFGIEVETIGYYGFGNRNVPNRIIKKIYDSIEWDEDYSEDYSDDEYGCVKEFPDAGEFGAIAIDGNVFVVAYAED